MLSLSPFLTTFKNIYIVLGTIWFASKNLISDPSLFMVRTMFWFISGHFTLTQGLVEVLFHPNPQWRLICLLFTSQAWCPAGFPLSTSLHLPRQSFLWESIFYRLRFSVAVSFQIPNPAQAYLLSQRAVKPKIQDPPPASRTDPPHLPSF